MKELFKEIFEYHNHFNQKLIVELKTHRSALPEKTHALFCHVLNAHQIWNARILGAEPFPVNQVHFIDDCASIDEDNFVKTLHIIESDDLERTVAYKNSKGQPFSNKLKDILFHVCNHSTHHKGQIISQFRQAGVEPLITDYIFYKR